jgi:hypothetical protein
VPLDLNTSPPKAESSPEPHSAFYEEAVGLLVKREHEADECMQ